ncbi:MAG: hypothetical protein PHT40_00820 [Patescibacteria group bacterium]|nr:hypothetical protein [Patescibacteria group bacterium]
MVKEINSRNFWTFVWTIAIYSVVMYLMKNYLSSFFVANMAIAVVMTIMIFIAVCRKDGVGLAASCSAVFSAALMINYVTYRVDPFVFVFSGAALVFMFLAAFEAAEQQNVKYGKVFLSMMVQVIANIGAFWGLGYLITKP